jgi:HSP20 family protein
MANQKGWSSIRPSVRALRNDLDGLLERFEAPRTLRRGLGRFSRDGLERGGPRRPPWWRAGQSVAPPPRLSAVLFARIAQVMGLSPQTSLSASEDVELLTERSDCFVVRFDLPDVRERDIDVRLDGEVLTVSGEHHHEETKREQGCAYTERRFSSFSRSIELPRGVDSHRIEAHYEQGVLEVQLPKRESPRAKQIPIVRHEVREATGKTERGSATPPGSGISSRRASETNAVA